MKKEIRIIGLSFIGLLLTAQVQRVQALPAPVASFYAMSLAEASSEAFAEAWADGDLVGYQAERDENIDAQRRAVEGYRLQKGDTIIIAKEMKHYLSGEEPSEWVYYVRHVVAQVGGKKYPDGILVAGIQSWIPYESAYLAGAVNKTAESQALEQTHSEQIEDRQDELAQKTQAEQDEIRRRAEAAHLETLQPVAKEPIDTIAETPVSEPVEPEVAQDTVAKDTTARKRHYNRFTVGVRGGLASLLHNTDNEMGKWKPGFDIAVDLQYAHYWLTKKDHSLGFIVGASVAYSMSSLTTQVRDTFQRATIGGLVDYTVSAQQVKEQDGEVLVEIPLMFSMIARQGFFLNVGPRFSIPVYTHYKQTMSEDVSIEAYFQEYDVKVPNEAVTGELSDEQKKQPGKWSAAKLNVMLTAEAGYEFKLLTGNSLSLGAYANYSVYTLYRNDTSAESLVGVKNPEWNTPAPVNVLSATDTYAKGIGYFDVGVKVAYHFNFPKLR